MKTVSRRNADDPVAAGNDGHGLANRGGIAIDQRGAQIDDGLGRAVGSGDRRRANVVSDARKGTMTARLPIL